MGAIQHRRLISIAILPVLARSPILACHGCTRIGTIDRRCRDKCSLRRDGMEETLLVEANTVLAATIRRVLVSRASDLCTN